MELSSFFNIIQSIIILIIVIILANFSLKYINKYMTRHSKLINIVERMQINSNSSIGIVNICGDYYLMSFTANDNKILKKLDKDEVETVIDVASGDKSFNILSEMRKKIG